MAGGRSRVAVGAVIGLVVVVLVAAGFAFRAAWTGASSGGTQGTANASKSATPAAVQAIIESAQAYVRRGEVQTAETVLAAAVGQYVECQELHVAYADVLLAQRKTVEAYAEYERALAIGPRGAELEFTSGNAASMAGKSERALEHFWAAQTADPANARYPLYLAEIQLKLNQTDAAKASLLRAANLDPNQAVAWGTMAEVALRENKLEISLQHIARARKLEPEVVAWRVIEARALARKGEPQKALDLLIGLNDADRFQDPVLKLIAECCGMLRKPGDAAAVYAKASDAAPGDAALAVATAEWFQKAGDKEQALAFAKRAAHLGSDEGEKLVKRLAEGG